MGESNILGEYMVEVFEKKNWMEGQKCYGGGVKKNQLTWTLKGGCKKGHSTLLR